MTTNSMVLSNQWASRPADQRFLTVADLLAKVSARRETSRVRDVALDVMGVAATDSGDITIADRDGVQGVLSHFAFGQLCARAKAPAGYLRSLPPDLAVIPLQWSMEQHEAASDEGNDAKILTRVNGVDTVAAITSPTYGRIWDQEVVKAIADNVDLDTWKVPAASYSQSDPLRATTLYASDRDVFLFLCNENTIDVDGESLNRGFYVWNSEVGSATFGFATFTYDHVCDNRIIWGMGDFKELTIRHTSGGPHRFAMQASPMLSAYAESSAAREIEAIKAAKSYEVAKDRQGVKEWLRAKGFAAQLAAKAYDAAERDPRGYNPRSVWGLVQGLTDEAHSIKHTDERTAIEAKAGALLESMAA